MKRTMFGNASASLAVSAMLLSGCQTGTTPETDPVQASQTTSAEVAAVETAPCPSRVYWGDTHLHTSNSVDAVFNGVRLSPEDAFRFARGEEVRSTTGLDARLSRPLDFLVVSDHAELIGVGREIAVGNSDFTSDPVTRRWYELMNGTRAEAALATRELIVSFARGDIPAPMQNRELVHGIERSTWSSYVETTERYNDPGTFTTFIGYEYSSLVDGNNLHRIVMYRDGAETFGDTMPFSSIQSPNPEDLWTYLAGYEESTGGRVMAIPHNSNLSNGLMFANTDFAGNPMTREYAERRARWEPIVEATQIKGDSEAHPALSPDDEFADFGVTAWDIGNLSNTAPKTPDMLPGEYLRTALQAGLRFEQSLGVNPFRFGMIGATDSHTGLSTGDENNFFGKFTSVEPRRDRGAESASAMGTGRLGWNYLAGGYAGVWAESNTRGNLFDAMARREVYATTGPRMTVRMFAGWDLAEGDLVANPCSLYDRAVPMGGDLRTSESDAPRFLVTALKDPEGANLDRVQIVKGWLDENGETHEQVYDVVWSSPDSRRAGADGRLPPVGNTVNLTDATYTNSIGAAELRTVWTDPDFDPQQRAFYYVRVLEIPTPRWPLFDRVRFGSEMPDGIELVAQERAYGSPVWYSPQG